jgi:hypothetical protein
MVVPREHGAWGMLLLPLLTGSFVAAGTGMSTTALALFAAAAVTIFWMRTPAEAWLGTTAIRAQSPAERSTVTRVALALALLAIAAVGALFAMGLWRGLLVIGTITAAAFSLQAAVKGLGRAGRMPAQVIGAVGLTSTAAGAYYVSTGRLDRVALALWLSNWLFAGNQVHYVQVRIRGTRLANTVDKVRHAYGFLAGQVALLTLVVAAAKYAVFPVLAVLAFVPILVRGFRWFARGAAPLDVHRLGFLELTQAIVFGLLLTVAYRW